MINETRRKYRISSGWRSGMLSVMILLTTFVSSQSLLPAQNPPTVPAKVDARQMYGKLCAGCHGTDAHGTQQGPGLSGNAGLRRRPISRLRTLIRNGIPAAGMPPFDLPDDALDALATLVVSLNSLASEATVPGDRAAGKTFFFGQGHCDTCQMVSGMGQPLGPDLSDVGMEMTVDQIREALLQPDAGITPGYELVTLRLRDGQTLRGFARSRTNLGVATLERRPSRWGIGGAGPDRCGIASSDQNLLRDRWRGVARWPPPLARSSACRSAPCDL
jgi:cytochrome c2